METKRDERRRNSNKGAGEGWREQREKNVNDFREMKERRKWHESKFIQAKKFDNFPNWNQIKKNEDERNNIHQVAFYPPTPRTHKKTSWH